MLSNLLLGTELVGSGLELEPKTLPPEPGLLTSAKLLSLSEFLETHTPVRGYPRSSSSTLVLAGSAGQHLLCRSLLPESLHPLPAGQV